MIIIWSRSVLFDVIIPFVHITVCAYFPAHELLLYPCLLLTLQIMQVTIALCRIQRFMRFLMETVPHGVNNHRVVDRQENADEFSES